MPCVLNPDVTKPHYRGGRAALRKGVLKHRPRSGVAGIMHWGGKHGYRRISTNQRLALTHGRAGYRAAPPHAASARASGVCGGKEPTTQRRTRRARAMVSPRVRSRTGAGQGRAAGLQGDAGRDRAQRRNRRPTRSTQRPPQKLEKRQSDQWREAQAMQKRARRAANPELYRAIDQRHELRRRDERNAQRRAAYAEAPEAHRAKLNARRAAQRERERTALAAAAHAPDDPGQKPG